MTTSHQDAAGCLAHGGGRWQTRSLAASDREAFELDRRFVTNPPGQRGGALFNDSHWWWGICDDYQVRINHRPPHTRPALQYRWVPEGRGCQALRHGRGELPPTEELADAFCSRYANKSVLFVGDSIQGQLFTTFAHMVGFVSRTVENFSNPCYKWKEEKGAHEIDVTARLCRADDRGVTARFLRNEFLSIGKPRTRRFGRTLCDWWQAASEADLLVLSFAYTASAHAIPPGMKASAARGDFIPSNDSIAFVLTELRRLLDQPENAGRRVVFRGLHSSYYNCSGMADPLVQQVALASRAEDSVFSFRRRNDAFGWGQFRNWNEMARRVTASLGVPFFDVFPATSLLPGSHRIDRSYRRGIFIPGKMDCAHYCIPGAMRTWPYGPLILSPSSPAPLFVM